MSDDSRTTGKCLCGAVRLTLARPPKEVGACHCNMCRRWASGPSMAFDAGKDLEIEGKDHVTAYRSSEWGERAFCKTCGSNLYFRLVEADSYVVCVGLLDDQDGLAFTSQIFIDAKPAFYDFANNTKNLTEAEFIAIYAPPADKA